MGANRRLHLSPLMKKFLKEEDKYSKRALSRRMPLIRRAPLKADVGVQRLETKKGPKSQTLQCRPKAPRGLRPKRFCAYRTLIRYSIDWHPRITANRWIFIRPW